MAKVEKVTVSLPASLLAFIERERTRTGASRSETVVGMLSEVQRRIELAEREARYAAAYARQPEAAEERAFADAAAAVVFDDAGEMWADVASSGSAPAAPQRSAGRRAKTAMSRSPVRGARKATRESPKQVVRKAAKRAQG